MVGSLASACSTSRGRKRAARCCRGPLGWKPPNCRGGRRDGLGWGACAGGGRVSWGPPSGVKALWRGARTTSRAGASWSVPPSLQPARPRARLAKEGGGAYLEKGATHTGPHRHDERLDLDWELCAAGQLDGVAGNVAGGRRELALRVAADARCAASGASGHGRGARGGGPSISNKWARRRRQSVKFLGRGGGRACACKARAGWGLLCPPAERGCNVCNQGPAPEPAGG
jgi:hypothetical protein